MKIIIDGLWELGKTTLCDNLSKETNAQWIKEPNVRECPPDRELLSWIEQEHLKNLDLFSKAQTAIMERSIISHYCFKDNTKNIPKEIFQKIKENTPICIILIIDNIEQYFQYLQKTNHKILQKNISKEDLFFYQNTAINYYEKIGNCLQIKIDLDSRKDLLSEVITFINKITSNLQ